MKFQICSDLHLEFSHNRKWLKENPIIPKADILLIAGDTYYLNRTYAKLDFIKRVSDEFEEVYLIPGNHEYYEGFDVSTALSPFELSIKENVSLVNNKSILLGEVNLVFSTFWSTVEKHIASVLDGVVDFRRIKFQEEQLQVDHFNELHEKAFEFVSGALRKDKKNIVVTHHLPSNLCSVDEFKDSPLNEAFCAEKTHFITDNEINYWIYGHSHRNKSAFSIANTHMVTNQLGYVKWNEHHSFNPELVVDM